MKNSPLATPATDAAPGAPGAHLLEPLVQGRYWHCLPHGLPALVYSFPGVISEIYCPTVDTPNTRELHFLVSDGESFCHEEKRDLRHAVEMPERGAALSAEQLRGHRALSAHQRGARRPHSSVLPVHTRLEIADESLRGKLRLFALLSPHLGGRGAENAAQWLELGERTLLHAEREDFHSAGRRRKWRRIRARRGLWR